jgi:hypothetical protein
LWLGETAESDGGFNDSRVQEMTMAQVFENINLSNANH